VVASRAQGPTGDSRAALPSLYCPDFVRSSRMKYSPATAPVARVEQSFRSGCVCVSVCLSFCVLGHLGGLTFKLADLRTGYLTHYGWRFSAVHERSCSTLSPVSTGMGYRLRAGIPPWYVIKLARSTQPCIPLGSLNRVLALIGWGKGGNVTSAGWQVTLCDPI